MPERATGHANCDELLTVAEAAEKLRVGTAVVYRLIGEGELFAHDITSEGSKKPIWRIPVGSVAKFLKRRSNQRERTKAAGTASRLLRAAG